MSALDDLEIRMYIRRSAAADVLSMAGQLGCSEYEVVGKAIGLLKATLNAQSMGMSVGSLDKSRGVFTHFVGIDKESIQKQKDSAQ